MCYSARVKQDLARLEKEYHARANWAEFELFFARRLEDPTLKVTHALEANFESPATDAQKRIKSSIEAHRDRQEKKLQVELFKQNARLNEAQRSFKTKDTQRAREALRIATSKTQYLTTILSNLRRTEERPDDGRIFPMVYAPLIVSENGERVIKPMRFTCRLAGKPASYDKRYPHTYTARRDNLEGYWKNAFGATHGILVITSFFEIIFKHLYEKRELAPAEESENVTLHFSPTPPRDMIVACLWSHWGGTVGPSLDSFAAITDVPPAEVAATGHDHCIVTLQEQHVDEWLEPGKGSKARMQEILNEAHKPIYENRIAM